MATEGDGDEVRKLACSFLGLSFSVFLALLPREVSARLYEAEEQLRQMKSRRKEDSKANARVVEIFASHRNSWQAEEKRLLHQIDAAHQELERFKGRMEELEREIGERDEMIGFMSRRVEYEDEDYSDSGGCATREIGDWSRNGDDFLASPSKPTLWKDVQHESLESMYHMKQFVARESPWKVDSDSTGVSSKLKLLEQELLNLEKIGGTDLSKVPSLMRKQAKRYQSLSAKMDDLCARMTSNPAEPALNPEFRKQRQTEFLLEAFRLQQRAAETGQKLADIQSEIGKSYNGDEVGSQAKLTTKRSLDSIRNNLREIQRNLEIWLARMIGDLEGILARDGASRVREYYMSRYPFVQ